MQFRELGRTEMDDAFSLLLSLHPDLTPESFAAFINANSPHTYRPLGAFERNILSVYAGVSLHENLTWGRYLAIDDFIHTDTENAKSNEMIEYVCDFAKMHGCKAVLLIGKYGGIKLEDLSGFRPKRDGFIRIL